MQCFSLTLTVLIVELAVAALPDSRFMTFVLALPIGLVGGYLAPIARDLLAALQNLRSNA